MKKIPIHNRTTKNLFALVDDEDFERVNQFRWWLVGRGYAATHAYVGNKRVVQYLHRLILNPGPGLEIDHRNRNRLDCRKQNIRACTHKQNLQYRRKFKNNSSGYKGVYRRDGVWVACASVNGRSVFLGGFSTPEEAARKYNEEALRSYGEFADLNEV